MILCFLLLKSLKIEVKNIFKYPTQIKKLVNHNEKIRVRVTSFFFILQQQKFIIYILYSLEDFTKFNL